MNWDAGLTGPHRDIAGSHANRIGVLAGPGTGKTALGLMRRIVRLLGEGGDPERILLLSFTRTAAQDLRDKVASLGVEGADEVRATTLHSYCFGLLQRDAVLLITQRTARPLMKHESDLMLRDLQGDFGDLKARHRLLEAFEAGWARGSEDHPGTAEVPADKVFQAEAIRWLRHHRAMLIGEVVPIAYNYVRANPLADALSAFDHVIVDEYQDLNFLEQSLLDRLADSEDVQLCIAGDDDQSIYGFRHANPIGIQKYLDRAEVERHEINVCGRCPRIVLSMANSLISHAPGRTKPPVICLQDGDDGEVAIVQWQDLNEEVDGIVAAISRDVQSGRREPGEVLVLTHRQKIGEQLRRRLVELGVSAHSFFAEEAVKSSEAQGAIAYLRLAVGDDPVSLRVVLGLEDQAGRADAYNRLSAWCRQENITERAALERARAGEGLGVSVRAFLPRYKHALNVIASLPLKDLPALVDALFPAGRDDVMHLRAIALDVLPDTATAQGLLDGIIVKVTQTDVPASPDYVRIMSLHKSKGLTSPAVFIVGMVDGIVPTLIRGMSEAAIEESVAEQRRLVYVALTRAAQQLVVSSSTSMELALASSLGVRTEKVRRSTGRLRASTLASPYMAELGPDAPVAVSGTAWIAKYGA